MRQTFHTFRAETLDEAYGAMRRRLGDEAVVLRTTTVPAGGIWNTLAGKKLYEITASATEPVVPQRVKSALENKYLTTSGEPEIGSDQRVQQTLEYFKKLAVAARKEAPAPPVQSEAPKPETPNTYSPRAAAPTGKITPPAPRGNAEPAEVIPFLQSRPELSPAPMDGESMESLKAELTEMREMLHLLSAENPGAGLPQEFAPQYHRLREAGVTRKRAAALVGTAARRGDLRGFRDPRVFEERLKMELRRSVRVTGGTALEGGQRKVVALVGPTGVGKTTNLAKLAARFAVQEHARVGIITTDTYRVAATDQLSVYANIIDIDMKVADDPDTMKAAMRAFQNRDLVLIDTAGGSPYNAEQMGDALQILAAARPDETHLLVSAATSLDDLRSIVSHFSVLEPGSIFFTKLDETKRYGALYTLAAETGLPLSYFSLGQNVPDDLRVVSQSAVANLLMEGELKRG